MSKTKQKEGVKTYIGKRVSVREFKRMLGTAKSPAERAAIKRFVLGADVQYFPKEEKTAATASDQIESAIKGKTAQ